MNPFDVLAWTFTITTCVLIAGAGLALLELGAHALKKEISR